MKDIRTILVAVKDADANLLPAVAKAMQIAGATQARVELLHVMADPLYELAGNSRQRKELQDALQTHASSRLESIAARFRRRKLEVDCHVEWDFPVHEAVIRRAGRIKADLIVAERHAARHSAPWLLRFTDWELIRQSPIPVLLVKQRAPYRRPKILAALDPGHSFSKPADLDERILSSAGGLARALRGTLHAMHAYEFLPVGVPPGAMPNAQTMDTIRSETQSRARRALDRAASAANVPTRNRHLVHGLPFQAIPDLADRLGSAIVVMGAISRSGLKALLIGNTAERVIDALKADILVIKPRQFQSRVRQKSRGMRLVASPFSPVVI